MRKTARSEENRTSVALACVIASLAFLLAGVWQPSFSVYAGWSSRAGAETSRKASRVELVDAPAETCPTPVARPSGGEPPRASRLDGPSFLSPSEMHALHTYRPVRASTTLRWQPRGAWVPAARTRAESMVFLS